MLLLLKGSKMAIKYYIIDTNVFMGANGMASQLNESDVDKCRLFVCSLFENTAVSVDLQGEIFKEYFAHMNRSGQPGIGDAFVKYLWDRQYDKNVCELVSITKTNAGVYANILERPGLLQFDQSDLKFIAVYFESKNNVVICNACDSDWGNNKALLKKYNINVMEILEQSL